MLCLNHFVDGGGELRAVAFFKLNPSSLDNGANLLLNRIEKGLVELRRRNAERRVARRKAVFACAEFALLCSGGVYTMQSNYLIKNPAEAGLTGKEALYSMYANTTSV